MASKSGQQEPEKAEVIEELLDALDTALDRVKVLYEQYFLGIQKQPPAYLHTDVERKIRDLAQLQIRNTALRYRFATLQQKFGSYNSYWRRTLRQIENGTYTRNLYKVGRQAARTGAEVPEEILAAMPKRMREQVIRDRDAALAIAQLRERQAHDDPPLALADQDVEIDVSDLDAAFIRESSDVRRNALTAARAHRVDEADAEFDVDALFASVSRDDARPRDTPSRPADAEPVPPAGASARSEQFARPPSRPPVTPAAPARPPVRRPIAKRPPTSDGPPGLTPMRKITGLMQAVRPPSSPGEPAAPGRATGRLQTARPPSSDDTEPRLSIPPAGLASPATATRRITGPMRTVRPPSNPDPDPASGPSSAVAPDRVTGQTAATRPSPSEDTDRRLSIPPIGSANPGAATRRITPPPRATRPPSNPDPEPASPWSSSVAPGSATGEGRAVAAPSSADGSTSGSAPPSPSGRATGQGRAATAPSADTGPPRRDAAGSADVAGELPVRDASAFAAEPTQRGRVAGIPVTLPVAPASGAEKPSASPGPPVLASDPPTRPDPARTAPSQATTPLRVAPGSAAAHAATPVETLAGPFPRIPGPLSSLAAWGDAAVPPEPPAIPASPPLGDRASVPPRRPTSESASAAVASPVSPSAPSPTSSRDSAAGPAGDSPWPAPPPLPSGRRTPPPMRSVAPPAPSKHADAPRPGPGERPPPEPRPAPPPGMTDADVHALYTKYVKAKQILGEEVEPGTYGKLLKTIHAQAPRIMEQYKATGVDFSVVVKDNQVIIRAKPKP